MPAMWRPWCKAHTGSRRHDKPPACARCPPRDSGALRETSWRRWKFPGAQAAPRTAGRVVGANMCGTLLAQVRHIMRWANHEFDDIPGTYVFDVRRAMLGCPLNRMCTSFNSEKNRPAFLRDEAASTGAGVLVLEQAA